MRLRLRLFMQHPICMCIPSHTHTHTRTTTGTPSKSESQKSPSPLLMINRISFSFFAATEFLNAIHIIAVVVIANAISCCLCMSCAQNATHGRRGKTALRASDGCWAGKESRKWQNRITANCMGVSSVVFVFVFLIFFPGTLDIFVLALPQFEFRCSFGCCMMLFVACVSRGNNTTTSITNGQKKDMP